MVVDRDNHLLVLRDHLLLSVEQPHEVVIGNVLLGCASDSIVVCKNGELLSDRIVGGMNFVCHCGVAVWFLDASQSEQLGGCLVQTLSYSDLALEIGSGGEVASPHEVDVVPVREHVPTPPAQALSELALDSSSVLPWGRILHLVRVLCIRLEVDLFEVPIEHLDNGIKLKVSLLGVLPHEVISKEYHHVRGVVEVLVGLEVAKHVVVSLLAVVYWRFFVGHVGLIRRENIEASWSRVVLLEHVREQRRCAFAELPHELQGLVG